MSFESDQQIQMAIREAAKNHDFTLDDALFYSEFSRLSGGLFQNAPIGGQSDSDWQSSEGAAEHMDSAARGKMFRYSRRLVRDESVVWNILMKYIVYICGKGPYIRLREGVDENGNPKPHQNESTMDAIYPNGEATNLARLLISQVLTNGNIFCLHLPIESPFTFEHGEERFGYPQMRPILPDYIHTIVMDDPMALTPIPKIYRLVNSFKSIAIPNGLIPAENVTHLRINHEQNDGVWGISLFHRLTKEIMRYVEWLEQKAYKARADNLVYLFRFREGAKSGKKYELPDRPMMIDMNMNKEDVKPISMAQGSRDEDGYEFRLRLAQAVNLPEHMVTENAQLAAQTGKLGFPTRLFEYYQSCLTPGLQRVFAKTIGCSPEDVIVEWPMVDTRDRSALYQEVSNAEKDRLISKRYARYLLEYPVSMDQEIAEELQDTMAVGGTSTPASSGLSGMFSQSSMPTLSGDTSAPSIPGLSMTLPSAMPLPKPVVASIDNESLAGRLISMKAESQFGVTYEDIEESLPPALTLSAIGSDWGYAAEGAAVIGGFNESGDIWIIGEMTFKRVPSEEWGTAFKYAMSKWPSIRKVFTGSDEPELSDSLKKENIETETKHIGEDRSMIILNSYLAEHKIHIHQDCKELLTDLFPNAIEQMSGMAETKSRHDHRDAFRYLVIGLLEMSGEIENIGSPEGGFELPEGPEEESNEA